MSLVEIEILEYTSVKELKRQMETGFEHGYSLIGHVTTYRNDNGNVVYLATMIKDNRENLRGR